VPQEVHGHARIPPDYSDYSETGWVEAARWLQKNAKLFLKDKLPEKRYALMREILGARPREGAACCQRRWAARRELNNRDSALSRPLLIRSQLHFVRPNGCTLSAACGRNASLQPKTITMQTY